MSEICNDPGFSSKKREAMRLAMAHVTPGRAAVLVRSGAPFIMGRREGYRIWDLDGHALMDFHLNGGTFNLGHRNPVLVEVLRSALDELDIGNHHFPSVERAHLAAQLSDLAPGDMPWTVFSTSGSEAVDVAVKSARWMTKRRKVITIDAGYHGATGLSGAAGNDDNARIFESDDPETFLKVPFNNAEAIAAALKAGDVAAVMIETVPATCGFPTPTPGYLAEAAALARAHRALYIADEVQAGMGRTGKLWGVQTFGVEPDLMVVGKGLSGGLYPIAATLMRREVGAWMEANPWGHVSTFGGAELGCRVAAKALEISASEETLAEARATAIYLKAALERLANRYPFLSEIRATGLVMGLRFAAKDGGLQMMRALYQKGIWAIYAGFDPSVLQFKPGLLVDRTYCDEALSRFEDALKSFS